MPYSLPLPLNPNATWPNSAKVLGLPAPPQRIEGFDISNISGTFAVASLVSFRNGRPDRANYRRFKIKTVEGQDDFASVAEVVRRRYTRLLKEAVASLALRAMNPKQKARVRRHKQNSNPRFPKTKRLLPTTNPRKLSPLNSKLSSTTSPPPHAAHPPAAPTPTPQQPTSANTALPTQTQVASLALRAMQALHFQTPPTPTIQRLPNQIIQ